MENHQSSGLIARMKMYWTIITLREHSPNSETSTLNKNKRSSQASQRLKIPWSKLSASTSLTLITRRLECCQCISAAGLLDQDNLLGCHVQHDRRSTSRRACRSLTKRWTLDTSSGKSEYSGTSSRLC